MCKNFLVYQGRLDVQNVQTKKKYISCSDLQKLAFCQMLPQFLLFMIKISSTDALKHTWATIL